MATLNRVAWKYIYKEIHFRDSSGMNRRSSCAELREEFTVPEKNVYHNLTMGKDLLGLRNWQEDGEWVKGQNCEDKIHRSGGNESCWMILTMLKSLVFFFFPLKNNRKSSWQNFKKGKDVICLNVLKGSVWRMDWSCVDVGRSLYACVKWLWS